MGVTRKSSRSVGRSVAAKGKVVSSQARKGVPYNSKNFNLFRTMTFYVKQQHPLKTPAWQKREVRRVMKTYRENAKEIGRTLNW